jgi:hypothetical protein
MYLEQGETHEILAIAEVTSDTDESVEEHKKRGKRIFELEE